MIEKSDHIHIVQELMILPANATVDEKFDDITRHFAMYVKWRGPYEEESGRGGYMITDGRVKCLSRAGNWGYPRPFQQRQYRWETLEEAVSMAEQHISKITLQGKTYEEWMES